MRYEVLNEKGVVFGMLPESEQKEMQRLASVKGSEVYTFNHDRTWEILDDWGWVASRAYKVKVPIKELNVAATPFGLLSPELQEEMKREAKTNPKAVVRYYTEYGWKTKDSATYGFWDRDRCYVVDINP